MVTQLLVVHHSPTPLLRSLTDAVVVGATDASIEGVDVNVVAALDVSIDDFLSADGYLLGTPANFGYMSGAMKHAFDTTYDDIRGRVDKRPFSLWIHGRSDTTGARRSLMSVATGLNWRLAAEPVELIGPVDASDLERCTELGGTVAAGLMN
ncbi:flavodoxin family protein [Branchiibius cervicis]|uniref:Flavodoxin family protein n=1 Tax=Branchiibius cervicis TaxID=908252 RepID=A0ABW2APB3_9MICO